MSFPASELTPVMPLARPKSSLMESVRDIDEDDDCENAWVNHGAGEPRDKHPRLTETAKMLFLTPADDCTSSIVNTGFVAEDTEDEEDFDARALLNTTANRLLNEFCDEDVDEEAHEDTEEAEEPVLTDSARKRKEEEESERLAWELMREEQEELYNMQVQFIQSQQGLMNEEDYRALQSILQEAPLQVMSNPEGDDDGDDDRDAEEEEESEEWDYDRLLALGQALGDVKTERWRVRAQAVIESLPVSTYEQQQACASSGCHQDDMDYRCVVCMDSFESTDELRVLPCAHFFHSTCTAGWLADHNSCPSCKRKVTASP